MAPLVRLGLNFWQAAWVAAEDPARLDRELDLLADAGVRELRILAGAEGPDDAPARVVPSLQPSPGRWNERLLAGLEHALVAADARGMRAILCLGNFWSWSGGLAQYRAWAGSGAIPQPLDGPAYCRFAAGFYRDAAARALFDAHVEHVVRRLRAAPAVAVWEILNEPRGMHDPEGNRAFLAETAARIAALDPGRDIATGSEGSTADPGAAGLDFAADHASEHVTVATCHLWPENWGLWDPRADDDAQFEEVLAWSRAYLRRHAERAAELGKPLLVEELGLARDGRRLDAGAGTRRRDRFFAAMLEEAEALANDGLPVRGIALWTWSGESLVPGAAPRPRGGDPPHEPDGWYGIGARDASTLAALQGRPGAG
ncbi:MAG: glycoside hydrolase 5 family protein [Polyangiales bacterium]